MKKTAIVLFNLGGPDNQEAVKPFLFNLFNDKAIIRLPCFLRYCLAKLISSKREKFAKAIYQTLGGGSPILPFTQKQAKALEETLNTGETQYKTFIAMRYWHPMTEQAVAEVKAFAPDNILLLPLYPQFSTTTTQSSYQLWNKETLKQKLNVPSFLAGCYPTHPRFIEAHVALLKPCYEQASAYGPPRVLFSAHGLPETIVKQGDPYAWQIERTARAIAQTLVLPDWKICFQSRVGRLKWLEPSTETEIIQAGKDGVPLVIVPISFVSEHSETLVELDVEYKHIAEKHQVPAYIRVPALGDHPLFIAALKEICMVMQEGRLTKFAFGQGRLCPAEYQACLCKG